MVATRSQQKGGAKLTAPRSSALQAAAAQNEYPPVPKVCVVTGGTGFVGQRLVEMLVERGAEKVISLDIVPPPELAWKHERIEWRICDVTDEAKVLEAVKGAEAALADGDSSLFGQQDADKKIGGKGDKA